MQRPASTEYGEFYRGYVARVPDGDILQILHDQQQETATLLQRISEAKAGHRYAPGKWSIRQIAGHMIDAERIFAYRALCFARGEQQPLPGMDQDAYMKLANFDQRPLQEMAGELFLVRQTTLALFRSFDEPAWQRQGVASGYPCSVRALAYIIAGHERHHLAVLQERYL